MNKLHFAAKSILFILILTVQTSYAQDSIAIRKIKSFSQHFAAFSKSYPQEKVYLHFDNTSYYLGESIWFKAYTVRTDRNSLSNLSKILYVDLLDAEGYVVDSKKLKLENGECHGDFKLKTTNYGGFYEVRAYTRYMLNFGDANYFSRIFPVYDAPKNPGEYKSIITERLNSQRIPKIRPDEPQKKQLNLSFFPEGGNLIQNINTRIAFKASTQNGEDAIIAGSVYNDKNEKVADFSSEYQGMGLFDFKADGGKYYANVSCNGHDYRFDLPVALAKGYAISIDNSTDEKMDIIVQKNANTRSEPLGLSVSCRGVLYAFEQINPDAENAISFKFPKKLLPSGVVQITLYNATGDILAERLTFVNHQSQMKINLTQNKPGYQPLEKMNLDFTLSDLKNNPVETTFSLSVRDASTSSNNPYSNTTVSYTHLTLPTIYSV